MNVRVLGFSARAWSKYAFSAAAPPVAVEPEPKGVICPSQLETVTSWIVVLPVPGLAACAVVGAAPRFLIVGVSAAAGEAIVAPRTSVTAMKAATPRVRKRFLVARAVVHASPTVPLSSDRFMSDLLVG